MARFGRGKRFKILASRKRKEDIMTDIPTERQGAPPSLRGILCALCESGELWERCDGYVSVCAQAEEGEGKGKRRTRFPNLAGLCRYLGTGLDDLRMLREDHPKSYDRLLAIFEDEALNFDTSTTLLSSYMKKRLLFSADEELRTQKEPMPTVSYCFEHDVFKDGG